MPRLGSCPKCGGIGAAMPGPELPPSALISLTPAQQLLTLNALEVVIGDMTERQEVLAAGEVCNLRRILLGMDQVTYWDESD